MAKDSLITVSFIDRPLRLCFLHLQIALAVSAGHQAATLHAAVRAATFAGSRAAATPGDNAPAECLGDGT